MNLKKMGGGNKERIRERKRSKDGEARSETEKER